MLLLLFPLSFMLCNLPTLLHSRWPPCNSLERANIFPLFALALQFIRNSLVPDVFCIVLSLCRLLELPNISCFSQKVLCYCIWICVLLWLMKWTESYMLLSNTSFKSCCIIYLGSLPSAPRSTWSRQGLFHKPMTQYKTTESRKTVDSSDICNTRQRYLFFVVGSAWNWDFCYCIILHES